MEPAKRKACAMYIRVPFATSSMSNTWTNASTILLTISSTAQAYWIPFLVPIVQSSSMAITGHFIIASEHGNEVYVVLTHRELIVCAVRDQ